MNAEGTTSGRTVRFKLEKTRESGMFWIGMVPLVGGVLAVFGALRAQASDAQPAERGIAVLFAVGGTLVTLAGSYFFFRARKLNGEGEVALVFSAKSVDLPRLGRSAPKCSLRYADIRAVEETKRSTRPWLRVVGVDGEWSCDADSLEQHRYPVIAELRKRAGLPDPDDEDGDDDDEDGNAHARSSP
ncbi:MAG: hypothetical protein R3B13_25195 [Polyangiaceae bacterium]